MKDWFYGLVPREQLFVGVGALIVLVALLWAGIWLPLDKSHANVRQDVDNWERGLTRLGPIKARMGSAESGQTGGPTDLRCGGRTPVVIVAQTLRTRGLERSLRRSQPAGNGIRVEFENVAFDELVLWLGDLSSQCAMDVQAGTLSQTARSERGRINATLTLERSL